MTPQDQDYVKEIFKFFYPDFGPPSDITDAVGDLAALMLKEALEGSKAMDLVPRPPGFKPGVGWLITQAVKMFWRTRGKQRIYESVRKTVAQKHRSEFEMARAGIL